MTDWQITILLFCAAISTALLWHISSKVETAVRLLNQMAARQLGLDLDD